MMSHGIQYPIWLVWVSSPGCVPFQLPTEINPIPAKTRTSLSPYSIPSTSCPGPTLFN